MKKINLVIFSTVLLGFLNTSCSKSEDDVAATTTTTTVAPIASFTASVTSGNSPLAVTFTNNSTNATRYEWDFGDGNTSTQSAPSHTFNNLSTTTARSFTVTLKAFDAGTGTNSSTKSINVEAKTNPPTPSENLTGGPWKIVGLSETSQSTPKKDVYQFWPECQKDDILIFNKNGNYTMEEGRTKCNADDPIIIPGQGGTWSFTSGGVLLLDNEEATILEPLTETSVKFSFREFENGEYVIYEFTLRRQ
jgi:hypothetical protein